MLLSVNVILYLKDAFCFYFVVKGAKPDEAPGCRLLIRRAAEWFVGRVGSLVCLHQDMWRRRNAADTALPSSDEPENSAYIPVCKRRSVPTGISRSSRASTVHRSSFSTPSSEFSQQATWSQRQPNISHAQQVNPFFLSGHSLVVRIKS